MLQAQAALDNGYLTTLSSLIQLFRAYPEDRCSVAAAHRSDDGGAVACRPRSSPPRKTDGVTKTAAAPVRQTSLGSLPSSARGGDHRCVNHEEGANIAP